MLSKYVTALACTAVIFASSMASAQTIYSTSFEANEGYLVGNLNSQRGWSVSGSASVATGVGRFGGRAVQINSMLCDIHIYDPNVYDFPERIVGEAWVKPGILTTGAECRVELLYQFQSHSNNGFATYLELYRSVSGTWVARGPNYSKSLTSFDPLAFHKLSISYESATGHVRYRYDDTLIGTGVLTPASIKSANLLIDCYNSKFVTGQGATIDDVRMVSVPEPSTAIALFGGGLLASLLNRRKR